MMENNVNIFASLLHWEPWSSVHWLISIYDFVFVMLWQMLAPSGSVQLKYCQIWMTLDRIRMCSGCFVLQIFKRLLSLFIFSDIYISITDSHKWQSLSRVGSLTLALLMVQCSALFSWSYSKLKSKVPSVAVKDGTDKETNIRRSTKA